MNDINSHIEHLFKDELIDNHIPLTTPFRCIFLPERRLVIHCIPLQQTQVLPDSFYATLSNEAQAQKLKIIHLWEDVYVRHTAIVEARLLSLTGVRNRIHARQTEVIRIDQERAQAFLDEHHLQQYTSAYYKYALLYKDKIVAVATFSKSRVMTDGDVRYRSYELIRFASLTGTTVTGGFGKLLNYFIKQHHAAHIMTYADRDWSNGESYVKLGFTQTDITVPQVFYVDPKTLVRLRVTELPANGTAFIRVVNAGNIKYVLNLRAQHS